MDPAVRAFLVQRGARFNAISSAIPAMVPDARLEASIADLQDWGARSQLPTRWDLAWASPGVSLHPTFRLDWLHWIPQVSWNAQLAPWFRAGYSLQWGAASLPIDPWLLGAVYAEAQQRHAMPGLYVQSDPARKRLIASYLVVDGRSSAYQGFVVSRLTELVHRYRADVLGWTTKSGDWRFPQRVRARLGDDLGNGVAANDTWAVGGEWEASQTAILTGLLDNRVSIVTRDHPSADVTNTGNNVPWQWMSAELAGRLVGESR
jgi:hypothetical protein